jgi:integrating conjugative element protein (TIGR03761 family)
MDNDRVQSGTDRITLNIGSLRSQIDLSLHTYHAARLWAGRRPNSTDKHQGVLGLTGFLHLTNVIKIAAAQDDPYADWMIIQIEDRIEKAKFQIASIRDQVKEVIASIPKQLTVSENLNISPARMPLFVNSPLGFQGVYLLVEFDELARDLLLAQHIGLMGRRQMEEMLDRAAHQIRSTFAMVQNYRNTGVSRDDVAANNPRAREVIERYGLPPQDVLEGQKRSKFAPAINKRNGAAVEIDEQEVETGTGETEQEAGVSVNVETPKPVRRTRTKAVAALSAE